MSKPTELVAGEAGIQTQVGLTLKPKVLFITPCCLLRGQRTSHITRLMLLPGPPPTPSSHVGTADQRASAVAPSSSNPLRSGGPKSLWTKQFQEQGFGVDLVSTGWPCV